MTDNNVSLGEPDASSTWSDAGPWKQRNLAADSKNADEVVAHWLRRKQAMANATDAFKKADEELKVAIQLNQLDSHWNDLDKWFDFSHLGVVLQRTERKTRPVSAYSEELQAQIKKEQETRSPNVSVFYRAKLTNVD